MSKRDYTTGEGIAGEIDSQIKHVSFKREVVNSELEDPCLIVLFGSVRPQRDAQTNSEPPIQGRTLCAPLGPEGVDACPPELRETRQR